MIGIWGVVNVTPDSFSDGGRFLDAERAVAQARTLHGQGATVIDVGGESTRPGSARVPVAEEQRRVLPVVEALVADGIAVSIDTLNAATAAAAVRAGARIVNDVSGGLADEAMLATVADSGAELALGHWRGPSADMYARADYARVAEDVAAELAQGMSRARAGGIEADRLIVDPGIGFAKTAAQNWELLHDLDRIVALGPRVLVGTSRKRFLGELLAPLGPEPDADIARRDLATAVTSVLAARAGVWAVRVHDVAATRDALAVSDAWEQGAVR